MGKFKQYQFSFCLLLVLFLYNSVYSQKKESLEIQLWQQVLDTYDLEGYNGKIQNFIDNKGWQEWEEWSDKMNSNVLINDAKNGYLEINRFYLKAVVGAYKDKNNEYTLLKNMVNRYFNRSLSSNRNLNQVLPKNFGIKDFIPECSSIPLLKYSCFYIEAMIPQKGTETQLNLKLIPLGLFKKGDLLTYSFLENNDDNVFLHSFISTMVKKIKNKETLPYLLKKKFKDIIKSDFKIIEEFISKDDQFENMDAVSEVLKHLYDIYNLSSIITFKSVILDWNTKEGRFIIKDKVHYYNEIIPFKSFLENSEYYYAAQ